MHGGLCPRFRRATRLARVLSDAAGRGVEYDHMFMQDKTYTVTNNGNFAAAGTLFATDRIRQDVDLVTVRLNYRWGGPVVAKY